MLSTLIRGAFIAWLLINFVGFLSNTKATIDENKKESFYSVNTWGLINDVSPTGSAFVDCDSDQPESEELKLDNEKLAQFTSLALQVCSTEHIRISASLGQMMYEAIYTRVRDTVLIDELKKRNDLTTDGTKRCSYYVEPIIASCPNVAAWYVKRNFES